MRPRFLSRPRPLAATLTAMLAVSGCAHRVAPLTGVAPAPGTMLRALALPPGHRRITFRWELNDGNIVARGDGVVRLASPDSARVDLFLGGGFGAGAAVLIGDTVRVLPGGGSVESMIPPPPLLWAAFGRLALPPAADTILRVSGDTLRATLGTPVRWRVQIVRDTLRGVERVVRDRIVESVAREPGRTVRYELSGQRSLVLDIDQDQPSPSFDASIWRF